MKTVFDKHEAENVVVSYVPRKFPAVASPSAQSFVSLQAADAGRRQGGGAGAFTIDRIVSERTGIAALERQSMEEKVEREALERLKEIQEAAYKEAYDLGLEEGRARAYVDAGGDIQSRVESLDGLLERLDSLKVELAVANERHLVTLCHRMASRIAMEEVQERPEFVANLILRAVEDAKSDERILVRVSPDDLKFVEASRERAASSGHSVARVKLEPSDSILPGGCVIETNYGSVDATIEQRIKKLWDAVSAKFPKTSDVVGLS